MTEMPSTNRPCDGCDVVDDHPRFQYDTGDRILLLHYTCVPKWVRQDHPHPGFAAADAGIRGPDLVAAIDTALNGA